VNLIKHIEKKLFKKISLFDIYSYTIDSLIEINFQVNIVTCLLVDMLSKIYSLEKEIDNETIRISLYRG